MCESATRAVHVKPRAYVCCHGKKVVCCVVKYNWLISLVHPGCAISGQRNRDYNYINDTQDTRLPLHNEDAFGHGIGFKCKVILVVIISW